MAKQGNDFIFLGHSRKPLSPKSVAQAYQHSKQKAGIHKSGGLHALRHAFATHALEAGTDLYAIKQLLGHASITSTVRYVRMTTPILQNISSPVDKLKL